MIVRLTYNCDPESLGDIPQEDFVDALEAAFAARPRFRECALTVRFDTGLSRVSGVAVTDDDSDDPAAYEDAVREIAEGAWAACRHA